MTVITERGARRFRQRQGWLVAGAVAAAILIGVGYRMTSPVLRVGMVMGAFVAAGIAVWKFNRGPLAPEKNNAGQSPEPTPPEAGR